MLLSLPADLKPGRTAPFGAHLAHGGVNFAVFSEHATRIELCIFDAEGEIELKRYDLSGPDDAVFHGFLSGLSAGLVYGYRAHGPYAPERGHRFNPNKLLLDPYAREIVGRWSYQDLNFGYALGHPQGARSFDARDNAPGALKARVVPIAQARCERPCAPEVAAHNVVLYEVHVKGFSKNFAAVPAALRGTYAGLAHSASIAHFKALGVTTLSLLPVHFSISESHLTRLGLSNFWGYNSIGFFAPEPRWGRADSTAQSEPGALNLEFRQMVDALHVAGLEVVLDVVFNHSAEGDELGPSISFRGLDNASYYCAPSDDLSRCINFSGCGNTLNVAHPRVTQLVLDSLRYWVVEMGVDGFRFDLATVLARDPGFGGFSGNAGFNANAAFFTALRQDPVLHAVRLIAEPWDCGPQGYQLGRFPGRFIEWNDRFRDAMRRYWLADAVFGPPLTRGEFARRFCGSSDFFQHGGKRPSASVNFITAHDGHTLNDVLSYSHKHNHANGEQNRDGRDDELRTNFGVEGETADVEVARTRTLVRHALLASLMLAQGTPMLLAGDEIANSQDGNNNGYCQDNATGWLAWQNADLRTVQLVKNLAALRAATPLLHYPQWFASDAQETARARVIWHAPDGRQMALHDWHDSSESALAAEMFEADAVLPSIRILFNPEPHEIRFALGATSWQLLFDSSATCAPSPEPDAPTAEQNALVHNHALLAPGRTLLVLARREHATNSASMPAKECP